MEMALEHPTVAGSQQGFLEALEAQKGCQICWALQTLASKSLAGDRVILVSTQYNPTAPLPYRAPVELLPPPLNSHVFRGPVPSPRHFRQPPWPHLLASDWLKHGRVTHSSQLGPEVRTSPLTPRDTARGNDPFSASGCDT